MTQEIEDTWRMANSFAKRLLKLEFHILAGHDHSSLAKPGIRTRITNFTRGRIGGAMATSPVLAFAKQPLLVTFALSESVSLISTTLTEETTYNRRKPPRIPHFRHVLSDSPRPKLHRLLEVLADRSPRHPLIPPPIDKAHA